MRKRKMSVRLAALILSLMLFAFSMPIEARNVWGQLTDRWSDLGTDPEPIGDPVDPPPFEGVGLDPLAIQAGDQMLLDSLMYFENRESFDQAFSYFEAVALASEFYGGGVSRFKRWNKPLNLFMMGEYDETDKAVVAQVFTWLSQIEGMPELNMVESQAEANYTYMFYPLEELMTKFEQYPPNNWGLAYIWWDGDGHMTEGQGGVSTDKPDREARNHLIQEELIQSFGLLNDSYDYPASIFQQEWTLVQHPSDIDFAVLRMLYSPAITMNMTLEQAYDSLLAHYGLN